jgi:hypothetical protein
MYNTLLIKRRLAGSPLDTIPILSGGELAFSEKNNTLYYGSEAGTITIGGNGAFVDKTTNQTITGSKTFSNLTTLSSTTFSLSSVVDLGGNIITNIGTPLSANHAATKKYVDDLKSTVSGDFVDRSTAQVVSGVKTFFDNAVFQQNLTVTGNLSVLGESTIIETTIAATSAITITNAGSGPALTVTQTGSNDIATFHDDGNTALIIKDGGNVGIGIASPGEKLTVSGNVSASGNVFGTNGTFIGSLKVTEVSTFSSDISGTWGTSRLIDFIIDCGSF